MAATFTFELTSAQVEIISEALAEMQFKKVVGVVNAMQKQINLHLEAEKAVLAPETADIPGEVTYFPLKAAENKRARKKMKRVTANGAKPTEIIHGG